VIDEGLPDGAATELQRFAQDAERRIPVVCIAAQATAALAVRAMKAGAVDYLCLPVVTEDLAQAIATAVDVGRRWREEDSRRSRARALVARLTPREQSVFALVLDGMLNKQIACCLGSSEATVKVHRSRLMRKLEVRSLVELIRLGQELEGPAVPAGLVASGVTPQTPSPKLTPPRAGTRLAPRAAKHEAWRETA
jgi:FixJ family two-component response regulator